MTQATKLDQWALDQATMRLIRAYLFDRKPPTQANRKLAREVLRRLEERHHGRAAPEGAPAELKALARPRDRAPRPYEGEEGFWRDLGTQQARHQPKGWNSGDSADVRRPTFP